LLVLLLLVLLLLVLLLVMMLMMMRLVMMLMLTIACPRPDRQPWVYVLSTCSHGPIVEHVLTIFAHHNSCTIHAILS
jgi:hypothetical protein